MRGCFRVLGIFFCDFLGVVRVSAFVFFFFFFLFCNFFAGRGGFAALEFKVHCLIRALGFVASGFRAFGTILVVCRVRELLSMTQDTGTLNPRTPKHLRLGLMV